MGEIIDLTAIRAARRELLSVGESHAKSEDDVMAHEVRSGEPGLHPADPEQSRARRCEAILSGIKRHKMMTPPQRRIVARNLWRLLKRIERDHGVTRRHVMSHAGFKVESESTKRLYKLTLPRDLTPEDERKRTDGLNRSPRNYLKIARAVAELVGAPEAEAVTEVFAGSRYDQVYASQDTQFDEHHYAMVDLLADLAWHIDQETTLWDYYRRMFSIPCGWDHRTGQFRKSGDISLGSMRRWMADNVADCEEAPPTPSVRLYRELRCKPFAVSLRVSKARKKRDYRDSRRWPAIRAIVHAWREVRLSLGPATGPLVIGPLFEIRTVFDLVADEKLLDIDSPYLDDDGSHVGLNRGPHRYPAILRFDDPNFKVPRDSWEWERTRGDYPAILQSLPFRHYDFVYLPVTPETCDLLLSKRSFPSPEEFANDIRRESFLPHASDPTKFPPGTIGQELESALIDRASNIRGFAQQLLQDAKDKVAKLDAYERQYSAEVDKLHAAARSRWRRGTDEGGK